MAGSGTGWALWSLPNQTLLGLPGKLLGSTSLHFWQPSLMLNFAESSSVLDTQVATLRGVTFSQSTQQVPKPPGIQHPEAEHHQALTVLGSSSLAQGCSRSQKRDKGPTPAPHSLLPQGHLPYPQSIVGTKHPASSRASVPGIVKPEHKAAQEETDSGAPGKPGRNTTAGRSFLWEAQSQVLFSKAPLCTLRGEPWTKARAPTDAIVELVETRFLWKKSSPATIIYCHKNIFLLSFCWCNTDHVWLQPGREKLPTGSRKAEINLV